MPHLLDKKNADMLISHGIFTKEELESRCEIMLENYCKTVIIEANTMTDMVKKQILPAISKYVDKLCDTVIKKKSVSQNAECMFETKTVSKLSTLSDAMFDMTGELEGEVIKTKDGSDVIAESAKIRDSVLPLMTRLRLLADEAETVCSKECWPFPTYGELLFGV